MSGRPIILRSRRSARHATAKRLLSVDDEVSMHQQRHMNTRIDHLGKLSRAELRAIWEREFSENAPATLGRDILALGIAYARQERRHCRQG